MPTYGFYLTRLEVRGGLKKRPASITFGKGLNVVSGASDTGKSYILQCLDFVMGAGTPPEQIDEANGYETIWLELKTWDNQAFTMSRSLRGGDAELYKCALDATGATVEPEVLKQKNATKSNRTISQFLLSLSGLADVQLLAKKKDNSKWALSFRAMAHLCFIDEVRIYSKTSPVYGSGIVTQKTMEESLFRYLITGTDDSSVVTTPAVDISNVPEPMRRLVIEEMIESIDGELGGVTDSADTISEQLARVADSLAEATNAISIDREQLRENQIERKRLWEVIQLGQSRIDVLGRLIERFDLLNEYYSTDLNRLRAMSEAGAYLSAMPETECPVCGTETPWETNQDLSVLRAACGREVERIELLQHDLSGTNSDVRAEIRKLEAEITEAESAYHELSQAIENQLMPATAILNAELQRLVESQRELTLASALMNQRSRLEQELASLGNEKPVGTAPVSKNATVDNAATTSDTTAFCKEVRTLLKEWNFPDVGPVQFSEKKQDLVINGKDRSSHGKGVRAISYSAFVLGLLRYCRKKNHPHPGVVILDSPLVAYREPDSLEEKQQLEAAGVAERFYQSLSQMKLKHQIIVFENRDPPADLDAITEVHFSGNADGTSRCGFFPN